MVFVRERSSEYGHDAVSKELIDDSSLPPDSLNEASQQFIEAANHLFRRNPSRERGETPHVSEQYRHSLVGALLEVFQIPHGELGYLRRNELAESLLDLMQPGKLFERLIQFAAQGLLLSQFLRQRPLFGAASDSHEQHVRAEWLGKIVEGPILDRRDGGTALRGAGHQNDVSASLGPREPQQLVAVDLAGHHDVRQYDVPAFAEPGRRGIA